MHQPDFLIWIDPVKLPLRFLKVASFNVLDSGRDGHDSRRCLSTRNRSRSAFALHVACPRRRSPMHDDAPSAERYTCGGTPPSDHRKKSLRSHHPETVDFPLNQFVILRAESSRGSDATVARKTVP